MLGDIRQVRADDEFNFPVFVEIFMDSDATGLTGLFGIGINRQIFILDFDQLHGGLSRVFVLGGDRGNRFADVTNFFLSQERLVLNGFTVRPGRIFAGHDRDDAGILLRLHCIDAFDLCMRLRAKKDLAIKHVREDEIVAINGLPRDFFVNVNPSDWFANDCQFRHLPLLKSLRKRFKLFV